MELISKEAVEKLIDIYIEKHDTEKKPLFTAFSYDIDMLPTIKSRPKGEWEKHKRAILYAGAKEYMGVEYHECSNCKQDAEVLQAGGGCELLSNYCPHCGADMRGKE